MPEELPNAQFVARIAGLASRDDLSGLREFFRDDANLRRCVGMFLRRRASKADKFHPDFHKWYRTFPRRVMMLEASEAYSHVRSTGVDKEILLKAASRYAETVAGTKQQFIKSPANWLKGGGWMDEYEQRVGGGMSSAPALVTVDVWVGRLKGYDGQYPDVPKGTWDEEKWGLPPHKIGHQVLQEALNAYSRKFGKRLS
jgi:hypothetical protein